MFQLRSINSLLVIFTILFSAILLDKKIVIASSSNDAPEITSVSPTTLRQEGNIEVVINGKNFTPEILVTLGEKIIKPVNMSPTEIRFILPPQRFPGAARLSLQTQNGRAQIELGIVAKPLRELAPGEITTLNNIIPFIGDGRKATEASLKLNSGISGGFRVSIRGGIAVDRMGNLFISDPGHNLIRQVDSRTGIITSVAGSGNFFETGLYDGVPAITSPLSVPGNIAFDKEGNLFIADTGTNLIRRVDAVSGNITIVAGGNFSDLGDGKPATEASLLRPCGVALDSLGNLFIADYFNDRIRRVDAKTGIITTVAGGGDFQSGNLTGDGNLATAARLQGPIAVALDKFDNLFIADLSNRRIRRVDAKTGIITTVAGNGSSDFNGDDRPAIDAGLTPYGVALDETGNIFIADTINNRIRRVDAASGIITTVAGNGTKGFIGDFGSAINAALDNPESVTVDGAGNIFISDSKNNRIRRVDAADGIITTVAGNGETMLLGDNLPLSRASFSAPESIAIDNPGNLYIVDNFRIRRVDAATGVITTFAGNGIGGFSGDGGPAENASIQLGATGSSILAFDQTGNLFISDTQNNRIRRVDAQTRIITTVAGNGSSNFSGDGGPAKSAGLSRPSGIAFDRNGNLIIADSENHRIRSVNLRSGIITTVAGNGRRAFSGDRGPALMASFSTPNAVAIDRAGNLLILDQGNNRIRRVNAATGIINTIAGKDRSSFSGDGGLAKKSNLRFFIGGDLAVDKNGNIFISDFSNVRIRRIDVNTGIIDTIAGSAARSFGGDGGLATRAALQFPLGITLDASGNLYIADGFNNAVRVVKR